MDNTDGLCYRGRELGSGKKEGCLAEERVSLKRGAEYKKGGKSTIILHSIYDL